MRTLKVYGGLSFHNGKQEHAIAAVNSQKELVSLLPSRASLYYVSRFWAETGNEEDLKLALANPHKLMWTGRKY